jgi:hypothetical protein
MEYLHPPISPAEQNLLNLGVPKRQLSYMRIKHPDKKKYERALGRFLRSGAWKITARSRK